MSLRNNAVLNGKLQTVTDLENVAIELEKNITNLNKFFLCKLLKGFPILTNVLEREEPGIFSTVIRWYRLYLRVQISIDPSNETLLNLFEETIPSAITYIIGCLQHKTKEIKDYHYSLLEIMEELLENVKPSTYKKIINLETGTIACLWNPIDYAGNYNTQLKALKILSMLLKHFDNYKQNEELKSIKWTKLKLFQDKFKTIIQESKQVNSLDNTARELLNNYNMNLTKNVLVYSFHCNFLNLGTKYKFYKPLNLDKFWIDINYCPQTLSFNGRFKLNSESKYEHIHVILKIKNIKIENQQLLVNYHKPGEFSKYCKEFSAVSENFIQLTLSNEEEQRLKENHFVADYFNVDDENPPSRRTSDVFQKSYNLLIGSSPNEKATEKNKSNSNNPTTSDIPKNANQWEESPKISRTRQDISKKQPIRKMLNRKRKFFSSLLEEDVESEEEIKKPSNKKSKVKKPRQPKTVKKQVSKFSPIVDLTEIDDIPNKENVQKLSGSIIDITNDLNDGDEKCIPSDFLTSQQCSSVLKNVKDIYNIGDTAYAEPCQSYRNFKTQRVPVTINYSIDKKPVKPRGRKAKKETSDVETITSDKENIDPNILKLVKNVKGKHALSKDMRMISPNLFGTPTSNEVDPKKKKGPTKENTDYTAEMDIDLTADDSIIITPPKKPLQPKSSDKEICTINQLSKSSSYENILNDDLLDYEDVRIDKNLVANPTTISTPNIPNLYCSNNTTPTSMMNVSDIYDSDMELTQLTKKSNYIMEKFKKKELSKKKKINVVEEILNDWNSDDVESIKMPEQCSKEFNSVDFINNNDESNVLQKCVVYRKHFDNKESDSSDNDDIEDTHSSINFLIQPDFLINKDFVVMQNTNYCYRDNICNTPDKNNMIVRSLSRRSSIECLFSPNAFILRQIQVSTKEAVLVQDIKQKHNSQYCKTKKRQTIFYNHRTVSSNHQSSVKSILKSMNTANETGNNNNNIISPYENPPISIDNETTKVPHNKPFMTVETIDKASGSGTELVHSNNNSSNVKNISPYNDGNNTKDKHTNVDNCENTLKPSSTTKSFSDNYFLFRNPISYDDPGALDTSNNYSNKNKTNEEKIPSQHNISAENLRNLYNPIDLINIKAGTYSESENNQEYFENELSQLVEDFKARMRIRIENAQRLCLTNSADLYVQKVREITENLLRKSKEQEKELELLYKNIERLVTQMEWEYQTFIKRSKLYDNFKEITERTLDALEELNVQHRITSEYQDLSNQLKIDQNEVLQEVWQDFIEKKKKDYLNNIDNLSKI